ncbi:MAG: CDP-diacylglycerol--glycerol-3-phosphate 3-phosphatidyltransferase [Phycisphaerales bacterium]|nr:CDP-diacylglycerol--glycerol-3-phosphate 3-phosphatidyltransferase [Phycisphaerales bacterium]
MIRINIPNQITLARLALTIIFFAMLTLYSTGNAGRQWLLDACFWLYLVAAVTDIVDGYLARTWKQVTSFGRVVDPVVDKVMVCGAFVFFASSHFVNSAGVNVTGVEAWMATLILLRELLVAAIRSFSESHGVDFAANWVGKFKSFFQFATVCVILGVLAWYPEKLAWLRVTCIWITVIVTALSIIAYLKRAEAFLLSRGALAGDTPAAPQPPARSSAAAPARADRVSA